MEIIIVQKPQKNLQAEAYAESMAIAVVSNNIVVPEIFSDVMVTRTKSSSGIIYKQFTIRYSDGTKRVTTNYFKALGMAVTGNK